MKSAQPVLSGSKIKWTLEAVEQANPNLVRVDWLRFTMPVDSVVPTDDGRLSPAKSKAFPFQLTTIPTMQAVGQNRRNTQLHQTDRLPYQNVSGM